MDANRFRTLTIAAALAVCSLTCAGCWAAIASVAEDVASGVVGTAASGVELAHKSNTAANDSHRNESAADREDRCDSLQLAPPDVIEIRKSASGAPEYRELALRGGYLDSRWTVADDSDPSKGGWRPAVNFPHMQFNPPLEKALPAAGNGYLAYAATRTVSTRDQDRLDALTADFGGPIGTFNWNGIAYRYAISSGLPCFPPPG
ncbi:MAG: hypothetical protein ACREQI_03050 [Candidatus Binataceae bacterium]